MDAACWRNIVESLFETVLPEAAQTIRHQTGGLAVFLEFLRMCMPSLAFESTCCADKDIRVAMKISSHKKTISWFLLTLTHFSHGVSNWLSVFFRRSVLHKSSCLHYLLPDKLDPGIIDRLRHANTFKPLLIKTENFAIHSYHTAWIIIVINTASLNYVLYIIVVTNIRH